MRVHALSGKQAGGQVRGCWGSSALNPAEGPRVLLRAGGADGCLRLKTSHWVPFRDLLPWVTAMVKPLTIRKVCVTIEGTLGTSEVLLFDLSLKECYLIICYKSFPAVWGEPQHLQRFTRMEGSLPLLLYLRHMQLISANPWQFMMCSVGFRRNYSLFA